MKDLKSKLNQMDLSDIIETYYSAWRLTPRVVSLSDWFLHATWNEELADFLDTKFDDIDVEHEFNNYNKMARQETDGAM